MTGRVVLRRVTPRQGAQSESAVYVDGVRVGHVWRTCGWRDRLTRWGTRNTVHPHYIARWWEASGDDEEHATRRDAVASVLARLDT